MSGVTAPGAGRRLLWVASGALLAVLVGVVDFATGYELSFALFYLVAIGVAAWRGGRGAGLAIAVLSAVVWFVADRAAGSVYSQAFIPYWNAAIRLGFFAVVALLLATLRGSLSREQEMARVDALTGAANRRQFLERLDEELERARRYGHPLTVAYFDLDHFKQVNDTLGHGAGDRVLRTVTRGLLDRLRKLDTVARVGGDEFAVLLPETGAEAARAVVEAARGELLQLMAKNGWPVTFSVGVVTSTDGKGEVDGLIRQADELMYRVKREARNSTRYAIAGA